ncbi:MAG: isoprenylcysteine carboxylmethyltransferase family protein [Anaerolineales bacterium]|jgi:protein-S-isoprenylcysteine O-methyltransferase Ste14
MMGPLLTLLAMLLYAALHSLLASFGSKRRAEQAFGHPGRRFYRLAFNLVAVVTFLPVMAVVAAYPGQLIYRWPGPWIIVSSLGQLAAVMLLIIGLLQTNPWHFLGLQQLVERPSEHENELETGGLYRYVRHPLYSAGLLFIWLTPVMTTSVLALNIGISLYLYIGSTFEERRLLREFGPTYESYRRQVPRLIPCLGH